MIMVIEVFRTKKPMEIYTKQRVFGARTISKASITSHNQTRSRSDSLTLSRIRKFASDIFDIYLNGVDCAIST